MKPVLPAIALALVALPSPLPAQALEPLAKIIAEGAASDYVLIRCAALFHVVGERAYEMLSAEQKESIQATGVIFMAAAGDDRASRSGQSVTAAIVEGVVRDKANIEVLYDQRFDDNYARTGTAVAGDPVFSSDIEICQGFVAAVRSEINQR